MSREIRGLLIKEWAERRSIFWFNMVYMAIVLGYAIAYEIEYRTRAFVASYYVCCMMFGYMGSVLLAMSTATGEYSQRTLKFSASLPFSLERVAWVRLVGMWGCLLVPIICGGAIITLTLLSGFIDQAGLRSDTIRLTERPNLSRIEAVGFLWTTIAVTAVSTLQLSTLLSLLGTRCRHEATVGFIGAVVILLTLVFTEIRYSLDSVGLWALSDWIGGALPHSMAISWSYGEWDGSHYSDLELAPLILGPALVSLAITTLLAIWFARRYGSQSDSGSDSSAEIWRTRWRRIAPSLVSRLGIRWHRPLASMVWLTARQSLPLCLSGLTIAVILTLIGDSNNGQVSNLMEFRGMLPSNTWHIGILWGAIVAVGVFSAELRPNLEQFWRSRPISPGFWFWTKFVVGLIAVVGTLDGIPALMAWNSSIQPRVGGQMGLHYLACMPLIHAQAYALAVAAICLLRRPIPAAIAALLLTYLFDSVLKSIPYQTNLSTIDVFNRLDATVKAGKTPDLLSVGYPMVYGSVVLVIIVATLLARRSIATVGIRGLGLLIALLTGLTGITDVRGDEPPTSSSIIAGINQRQALVKHLWIRLKSEVHRTDAYFNSLDNDSIGGTLGRSNRRQQRSAGPRVPRDETTIAEIFDRSPSRAYFTFDGDGTLLSWSACDGSLIKNYTHGRDRFFRGTVGEGARLPKPPFLTPDESLMSIGYTPLTQLLETNEPQSINQREVDGETFIDVTIFYSITSPSETAIEPVKHLHLYQITLNASRNYWPVKLSHEISKELDKQLSHKIETEAQGWIGESELIYPKRIKQLRYQARPKGDEQTPTKSRPIGSTGLELFETQQVEILDVAVNQGLDDNRFSPSFPADAAVFDYRNQKVYEEDPQDGLREYVPKPAGIRGAVFTYHLIWMSGALVYLFRRQSPSRTSNASKPVQVP